MRARWKTSAGAIETKAEGRQSGKVLIVIVFECSAQLCVVGELACKAEGLAQVDVRLNVMTANLHCSATNMLAWRLMNSGWVCTPFLSQRHLPWFLLPSIGGLYG